MIDLGLNQDEADKAVDWFADNLFLDQSLKNDRGLVSHLGRQYFAVVERSEAMQWLITNYPSFYWTAIHEYMVVELETMDQAVLFKLRWC